MKKTFKIYLIAILCTACASYLQAKVIRVEKDIVIYKKEFESYSKKYCSVSIVYSEFKDSVIGACVRSKGAIRIDKTRYLMYTNIERKALIFHEMGHCCLNQGHNGTIEDIRCPSELMYPYMPSEACLEKNWDKYMSIMFKDVK